MRTRVSSQDVVLYPACALLSSHSSLDDPLFFEVFEQNHSGLLRCRDRGIDGDLGMGRRFIRIVNAGEVFQLTGAGLLVKTFGIARLACLDRRVDEDFDERELAFRMQSA